MDDTTPMSVNACFKSRLVARELLVGTFIKTPHPTVIEVLGSSGLDFLVLDAEHAPFDRASIDLAIMAGRTVACPIVVRVPSGDAATILGVLDSGAAGVMVPHVKTADQARHLAQMVNYGPDGRGFAATTRAGGFGSRTMSEHLLKTQSEVSLICQIEDPEGVDACAAIAETPGVDGLFVGRADLAVAYGYTSFANEDIAGRATKVLQGEGASTGLFLSPTEAMDPWQQSGASFFVIGSDHSLMTLAVSTLRSARDTS